VHVKSMTALHPDVPLGLRGTFLGLAHPAVIQHLKRLGVTALELLPIFYHIDELFLYRRGLSNFWGYNPISFFAPHPRFIVKNHPLPARDQFRTMVRELHRAGIEVVLDVVFNHTGESGADGPVVSFRGLAEDEYYLCGEDGRYIDYTGCGNTVNTGSPIVRNLVLDSLRYWVSEMGVDGFRFDLMSAIMRNEKGQFDREHPLLNAIVNDPILSQVKLISEPWDATAEGYQLGQYPASFVEWNDRFRDCIRRFWRGDGGVVGEFASRISGNSDIFSDPYRSINFVTAHDGFTLRDLVSFSSKVNFNNGEDNRDGAGENYSFNCGVEGETEERAVLELRERMQRNFLATLILSNGVPMFPGGDELSRTQAGNNNAYCHDEPWNYLSWDKQPLVPWISRLMEIRRMLSRRTFFSTDELKWRRFDGAEFSLEDWQSGESREVVAEYITDSRVVLLVFNPTPSARMLHLTGMGEGRVLATSWESDELSLVGEELEMPSSSFACIVFEGRLE
jgi:glycogen operon protein